MPIDTAQKQTYTLAMKATEGKTYWTNLQLGGLFLRVIKESPACFILPITFIIATAIPFQFARHYGNLDLWQSFFGWFNEYEVIHHFELHRLFTSIFFHANVNHLCGSVLLMMMLIPVERIYGTRKFLVIFFGGGILTNALSCFVKFKILGLLGLHIYAMEAGASGAIMAAMAAGALTLRPIPILFALVTTYNAFAPAMEGYRLTMPFPNRWQLFVVYEQLRGVGTLEHAMGILSGLIVILMFQMASRLSSNTTVKLEKTGVDGLINNSYTIV